MIVLIGVLSVIAYNPASTWMKERSDQIESSVFGGPASGAIGIWIRQKSVDGQAVIRAIGRSGRERVQRDRDLQLRRQGRLHRTRRPPQASCARVMASHDVVSVTRVSKQVSTYLLATNLDRREVAQAFVSPKPSLLAAASARRADRPRGIDRRAYRSISGASGAPADAGGDGAGGCMVFVKILPNGWDRIYGFRWRRGGVRAYVATKVVSDLGGAGIPQRLRCRVVARDRWLHVWRVCCCDKRMVDGVRRQLFL